MPSFATTVPGTYEFGGVVLVVKGKENAEVRVKHFETGQSSEDRHAGWRYFVEKSDLKAGMDPAEATNLRQMKLEIRGIAGSSRSDAARQSSAAELTADLHRVSFRPYRAHVGPDAPVRPTSEARL